MKRWRALGLLAFLVTVLMVALGMVMITISRGVLFKPQPVHRDWAKQKLQAILREDSASIHVPAVNADINHIYLTASLSPASVKLIKSQGKHRQDMPGGTWQFRADSRSCLVDLRSSPAKLVLGDPPGTRHWELSEDFYRKWIERDERPWED